METDSAGVAIPFLHVGPKAKLSERAAAVLARRILHRELVAGERLPTEFELGEILGVSRSVVRDAIRMLAALGLVEVRQGHGMVVTNPTSATFAHAVVILLMRSDLTVGAVLDAREAIETELGSLAALRGTEEDWTALEDRLSAYIAAVERGEWSNAHANHFGFHVHLLQALHLPALDVLLQPLHEMILISSIPPVIDDKELWDVEVHPPILEALRQRDREKTRAALHAHFEAMRTGVYKPLRKKLFRESPGIAHLIELGSDARSHGDARVIRQPLTWRESSAPPSTAPAPD